MRTHLLRTRSKLTTFALVGGLAFAGAACAVEDDDPDTVVTDDDDPDTVVTDDGGDGGDGGAEAEADVEVTDDGGDGATDDGGDAEAEAEAES